MILLIDNYDSFTYNVYQYVTNLGFQVTVVRNDQTTATALAKQSWEAIILSPGPGTPADSGICPDVIRQFAGQVPILGICLGHQTIGEVYGGKVVRAGEIMHGKVSGIMHKAQGLYRGLPQSFVAGRYHSLIVDRASLPDCLEITSQTSDGVIMGLKHKELDVEGVQFHPESVLTPQGLKILQNFVEKINNKTCL
jgi:anthranilate synthase component II